jgi:hypothetical protein
MQRPVASRLALLGLVAAALVAAQPRLTIALERADDFNPRRFALTGEVMGRVMGLVISWSAKGQPLGGGRQLIR